MKVHPEEQNVFEVCLVVPKSKAKKEDASCDCVEVLENAFLKVGFIVERIDGVTDEFMKVCLCYLVYNSFHVNLNNGHYLLDNSVINKHGLSFNFSGNWDGHVFA